MKKLLTFTLLVISLSIHSQIYESIDYGSITVGLSLVSDHTYCLDSTNPDHIDSPDFVENEKPRIVWSEGTYIYSNDTLICRDQDGRKVCYFLNKKEKNILKLVQFIGFSNDSPTNKQKIYDRVRKKAAVARIHDLFIENPEFFLTAKSFTDKKGYNKFYELYGIKDGVYQQVYKRDKNEVRKEFERGCY